MSDESTITEDKQRLTAPVAPKRHLSASGMLLALLLFPLPWIRTNAPDQQELAILVHTISHRVARFLERQGVLERDEENCYLQLEGMDEDPMQQLIGCSVSYRIAVGPQQGRRVFA